MARGLKMSRAEFWEMIAILIFVVLAVTVMEALTPPDRGDTIPNGCHHGSQNRVSSENPGGSR